MNTIDNAVQEFNNNNLANAEKIALGISEAIKLYLTEDNKFDN